MRSAGTRLARAQWAPLAALAVLMLVSALLAVAVPARTTAGYDRAAAAAVGPGASIRVKGAAGGSAAFAGVPGEAALNGNSLTWRELMPRSLSEVTGEPEASVTSPAGEIAGNFSRPRLLYLGWEPGAWRRIRLVSGGFPDNKPGQTSGDMNVVVAKAYADRLGYETGDRIELGGRNVRVSGLYAPVNPADPFWAPRARLLHPTIELVSIPPNSVLEVDAGTALIDPAAYARLTRDPSLKLNYDWRFPVRRGAVSAGQARTMARDLDAFRSAVQGRGDLFPCEVSTPLDIQLREFSGRLRTAQSVVGLAFGGLVAVAAGLLLLAAGLLGERLRPALGVMRARGASLRQLAAPACGLTALAAVPPALLGYAGGRLLDAGPPQAVSLSVIGLLSTAVLGVSAAMVLRERGGGLGSVADRRDDLVAARPSRRRLVLDALLVVLAVVGVVVLRGRGTSAGTDPLVPALLGAALGVLVLRAYPYLLRAAGPLLRRRTGAVAFIGLARASRQNLVGALPLAVLLLAATIAGFTSTVDTGLRAGQERASWAETGADARVEAKSLDEAGLRRIRAVPGVTGAVRVRVIPQASSFTDQAPMTVVGVDLDAYRRLAPDVPGIPGSGTGVLVSPLAARTLGPGTVTLGAAGMDPVTVKPSTRIGRFPGQEKNSAFVIVPYRAVAGATGFPSHVFVTGDDIDAEALRAAAPGSTVVLRRQVLRDLAALPLVSVVHDTFRNGAVAGGAFGLLAVLLMLVVGARARGGTIAHLRALGLSRRQSRRLALVELAPVLLCAVGAGWVLGLLLPEITGPAVDLRPYTGGFAVTAHVPGAPALLGLLAALLLAAAAAVAVDRAFDTDPGTALRTGD